MSDLFKKPLRYLITKGEATPKNFYIEKQRTVELVRRSATSGIELFQIREKQLPASLVFELASACAAEAAGSTMHILVNDRFDIALAAGVDGVHLTGKSIAADVVRKNVPLGFLIGVSTHSIADTRNARDHAADFAVFGPVFETPGKGNPAGLSGLKEIVLAAAPMPVIGVGGINSANCKSVVDAGAAGFAAIRYLNNLVVSGD